MRTSVKFEKRDLKSDISTIWKTAFNCEENFLFSKYLYQPKTIEESDYLGHSKRFQFIRQSLWRLSIIELNKLISKSNKDFFNFLTFIDNLRKNHYKGYTVRSKTLMNWTMTLTAKKATILKLRRLRNKVFAHSDPIMDNLEYGITFKEVKDLIGTIVEIIKDIHIKLLGQDIFADSTIIEFEGFRMIKILANERNATINKTRKMGVHK
jgi:hypothetical protein